MQPNFYEKDYLIIDELSYRFREPERGDVIVCNSPVNNDYYLKRIVALPEERVKIENNTIVVYNKENPTGFVLEENYIYEETQGSINVSLKENEYFVLGDNREHSLDSRSSILGFVDEERIYGTVVLKFDNFLRNNQD